jgi:hypothetical protein
MVHIVRHPKAVAVSLYHFIKSIRQIDYEGSWPEFFQMFITGFLTFGSWFNYMENWIKQQANKNVLFISYEDMKAKPAEVIRHMAQFYGVSLTEDTVDLIVKETSFATMKKSLKNDDPTLKESHFRKGEVDDWKNYFTVAQNETFDAICAERGLIYPLNINSP